MELEPKKKPVNDDQSEDTDDPMILAYRIGGPRATRGLVRVRKSELEKDRSLAAISKSARSHDFDLETIMKRPEEAPRAADSYIERKIQYKLMMADIRQRIKTDGLTLSSLPSNLQITSMNDQAAHIILEIATNDLKAEGLWRDEDKDLTMSEAFPLSQAKTDSRIRSTDLTAFDQGTFLNETDLTPEDLSADNPTSELPTRAGLLRLPVLATPMLHNLMRASPRDLYHQMARRMIDSHYFEDHPKVQHLFRACYVISKGVEDERHFQILMSTDLAERFKHYTFEDYRVERIALKRIVRELIDGFFMENPAVKRAVQKRREADKRDPKSIWTRFYAVRDSLTRKQQEAVEKVYVDRISKAEVAEKFGISIDSLNSRLKTAIRRFKAEFWELAGISPKKLPRKLLAGALAHNGLWRYETALMKSPLYKIVDLKANFKVEIEWNTLPKSLSLDWKERAKIKAEIIENCPVPHFHETEYFDGMRPTIASFGRKPGNFIVDEEAVINFDAGFREI